MEQGLTSLVTLLDKVRVQALRLTLPVSLLRSLFLNRALRLQALYLAAALFYLVAALFFPLWVLILGPIVWGIPHIFASIRYLPKSMKADGAKSPQITKTLFILWALVTCARVLTDQLHINIDMSHLPSNWPELSAALLTSFALFFLARKNLKKMLLSLAVLLPLIIFSWTSPFVTAGALIILHNWIAFIYWYRACKVRDEKIVVGVSFFLFALVHGLMFFGAFDGLYHFFSPQGHEALAQLDYSDLGKMIAPGSTDSRLWYHLVSMYAFGQALHYFIWLKAIPEQELTREFPASFQSSWFFLKEDFGPKSLRWILLVVLASVLAWFFVRLPQARALYFSVAAFHGYMEIAGLGFLKFDKIQ